MLGTRLRNLKKSATVPSGKLRKRSELGGKVKLTDAVIEKLPFYYGQAVKNVGNTTEAMRKDIPYYPLSTIVPALTKSLSTTCVQRKWVYGVSTSVQGKKLTSTIASIIESEVYIHLILLRGSKFSKCICF